MASDIRAMSQFRYCEATFLLLVALFRFSLIFQIRDVESAEPSEWEIAGRYICWTVMLISALVLFVLGLQ